MGEVVQFLTAEQILEADDRKTMTLEVPEWGGKILLRGLMGDEAAEYYEANKKDKEKDNAVARLICRSIVGADGKPVFGEDAIPRLKKKSMAAMMRVQRAVLRLNGLDDEAEKDRKND